MKDTDQTPLIQGIRSTGTRSIRFIRNPGEIGQRQRPNHRSCRRRNRHAVVDEIDHHLDKVLQTGRYAGVAFAGLIEKVPEQGGKSQRPEHRVEWIAQKPIFRLFGTVGDAQWPSGN